MPEVPNPNSNQMTPEQYQKQIDLLNKQNEAEVQKQKTLQAQIDAVPKAPDFKGLTDTNGNLLPQFQMSNGADYKKMAEEQLHHTTTDAANQAVGQNMGTSAAARTALATRGGLGSGSALRLAEVGMANTANNLQDVRNAGIKSEGDIQNKTFDIGRQAETTNLQNQILNQGGLNAYNQNKYNQQMQSWAANKSADAQANAANQGGKKGK